MQEYHSFITKLRSNIQSYMITWILDISMSLFLLTILATKPLLKQTKHEGWKGGSINQTHRLISRLKMAKLKVQQENLNFVECNNVTTLDILVAWLNCQLFLDKGVHRNKVIHNCHHDLQLLDSISHWHQFGCIN